MSDTAASELPALALIANSQSKAALDQVDVQPFEGGLLALARVHHPTVSWWHGYRKAEEGFGSFCYVCDDFIARWRSNAGPTMGARATIDVHKHLHRAGNLPATQTQQRKEELS